MPVSLPCYRPAVEKHPPRQPKAVGSRLTANQPSEKEDVPLTTISHLYQVTTAVFPSASSWAVDRSSKGQ